MNYEMKHVAVLRDGKLLQIMAPTLCNIYYIIDETDLRLTHVMAEDQSVNIKTLLTSSSVSRSDLSSFVMSLFQYGQGVSWVGSLCSFFYVVVLCLAWYGSQSLTACTQVLLFTLSDEY